MLDNIPDQLVKDIFIFSGSYFFGCSALMRSSKIDRFNRFCHFILTPMLFLPILLLVSIPVFGFGIAAYYFAFSAHYGYSGLQSPELIGGACLIIFLVFLKVRECMLVKLRELIQRENTYLTLGACGVILVFLGTFVIKI